RRLRRGRQGLADGGARRGRNRRRQRPGPRADRDRDQDGRIGRSPSPLSRRIRRPDQGLMDTQKLTRRAACAGLVLSPATALAARGPIVVLLGDSITAGLGLPAAQALPRQLHAALKALRQDSVVLGAGVSGDTAAGGAARVDRAVR